MRNSFDKQLEELNTELIEMGALCERSIAASAEGLLKFDTELSRQVVTMDTEIDQKERDIESLCMKLLLHQQPVARDLRQISSALKMITDMERIGDQAADISEITLLLDKDAPYSALHIGEMAREAIRMVTDSVDAYVRRDLALAREVIERDDVIDALFTVVKNELVKLIGEDAGNGEYAIDFIMIAKYLERIGDHATNIAEWVEFSITGRHKQGGETADDLLS